MKILGLCILLLGLALGGYSLNMNVAVEVPAREYGYGVSTPAMQVANVDKIAQRQNLMTFSGILSVVGAILFGFGSMTPRRPSLERSTPSPLPTIERESAPSPSSVSICPSCRHMGTGDATQCGRCGAALT